MYVYIFTYIHIWVLPFSEEHSFSEEPSLSSAVLDDFNILFSYNSVTLAAEMDRATASYTYMYIYTCIYIYVYIYIYV
jgi:hypothetical protein